VLNGVFEMVLQSTLRELVFFLMVVLLCHFSQFFFFWCIFLVYIYILIYSGFEM
jgi:hypothetical protein